MTTTGTGSVLEGVDNDVLLAFIALLVITVSTIIYFLNVNRSLSSTLSDSWLYLRTVIERQSAEVSTNEDDISDVQSSSGIVREDVGSERDVNDSGQPHQNEQTLPVTDQKSGPSDGTLRENSDRLGTESFENIQREPTSEEGLQGRNRMTDLPGSGQAGGDGLRNRAGYNTGSSQPSGDGHSASGLSIRVKHHEVERSFVVDPSMTVGELKRLSFPDEVAQGRRVRFIYSGRLLHDERASVSFYGISNYSVVHAQISDMQQHNSPLGQDEEDIELDMSRLIIPVLTFILCGCWYGLMTYRQLFDATSTGILVIITAAYAFMVYVMFY